VNFSFLDETNGLRTTIIDYLKIVSSVKDPNDFSDSDSDPIFQTDSDSDSAPFGSESE